MNYVHGYSERESVRLTEQANALEDLLLSDTGYPPGSSVLEAGCGVGAQTIPLAHRSPSARITAIDLSAASPDAARRRAVAADLSNVTFQQADLQRLPFGDETFDHVFVCFVLEHLQNPSSALTELRRVLRPGGTITCIEGDHGSFLHYPWTDASLDAWNWLIEVQAHLGGDSLIGRRLFPLLREAGFRVQSVSPRVVYADARSPGMRDVFASQIIAGMVQGIGESAADHSLISPARFQAGLADLRGLPVCADATLCYTFFKAEGNRADEGDVSVGGGPR
jgi:SAM-dependent methyltransferase